MSKTVGSLILCVTSCALEVATQIIKRNQQEES
jgi:hypothetical protein